MAFICLLFQACPFRNDLERFNPINGRAFFADRLNPRFMKEANEAFDILTPLFLGDEVTKGKLFGHRCLKVVGKAFVVDFDDDLVFKLGRDTMAPLLASHDDLKGFDPSGKGRSMKDWLQSPMSHLDSFVEWAEAARDFTKSTA